MSAKKYTPQEQAANALTHLLGVILSVVGIWILVANSKNAIQSAVSVIFGLSLISMFLASVFYHSTTQDDKIKFFQKLDHSAIYLLIAGTYTPGLVFALKFPMDVIMLSIIWILAVSGIILTFVGQKSKIIRTGLYLLMGWVSVIFFKDLWAANHLTVWLLLAGGLLYSLGCVFYLSKFKFTHSIWHLFVLAGATLHYLAILDLLKVVNHL